MWCKGGGGGGGGKGGLKENICPFMFLVFRVGGVVGVLKEYLMRLLTPLCCFRYLKMSQSMFSS